MPFRRGSQRVVGMRLHGLGRQILHAGEMYDIALIWVAVIILSTLAVVMYLIVGQMEKILLKGLMRGSAMR